MGDALDRVRSALKKLKVFPLPPLVLLPGSALPLHIFEARYRQMVEDALATDGVFAMAQVKPGEEGRLAHEPVLEELLSVGVIAFHEVLEDGRFDLVLAGVARARLVKEHPRAGKLYREVEAELIEDPHFVGPEERELRGAVMDLLARVPIELGERLGTVVSRAQGGSLADVVAAAVISDAPTRYEILSTLDVGERLAVVTAEVLDVVGRLKPQKPDGLLN
jgi:Lon protease-like protein